MDIEISAREESDDESGPKPAKKRRRRRRKPSKPVVSTEKPAWSRLEDLLEQRRLRRELADFEDDAGQ